MSLKEDFDECRHMWDGSQDWALHRFEYEQVALTIVFQTPETSVREIAAVRQLLSEYQTLPPSQARSEMGSTGRLELKSLPKQQAIEIARQGEQLGLRIESTDASYTSYLPVRRPDNMACIIEEDDLVELVITKMLAVGVPIIDCTPFAV